MRQSLLRAGIDSDLRCFTGKKLTRKKYCFCGLHIIICAAQKSSYHLFYQTEVFL